MTRREEILNRMADIEAHYHQGLMTRQEYRERTSALYNALPPRSSRASFHTATEAIAVAQSHDMRAHQ